MANNSLTELGLIDVNEILSYLKQQHDEQIEVSHIFIDSLIFYPQITGDRQAKIFKYLENKGFLSVEIKRNFVMDGKPLYEDDDWLEGLEIFNRSIHEPFDRAYEIELMKNSYTFRIDLAEDFDKKYKQSQITDDSLYEVVYQLRLRKKDCQLFLCVNDRIICKLQEGKLPRKVLLRLFKSGNNCWVKVGDLFAGECQNPSQLLNSVMKNPELRKVFFPDTTKNTIFVRNIITVNDLHALNIDRKSVEKIIEALPLF